MTLFSAFFTTASGLGATALGIAGIGFLIGIHELGHFLFCKLFNVHTPSFSIGFGPKLISRKIGDTQFSLGIIPLGGYVEIAGNHEPGQGEQEHAELDDERSFKKKHLWQKLFIISGGIFANVTFAYIVVIGLFISGIPSTPLLYPTGTTTIKTVVPSSAAARAELKPGDTLISVDAKPIRDNVIALNEHLGGRANTPATFLVERAMGGTQSITMILDAAPTVNAKGLRNGRIGTEFETGRATPAHSVKTAIREGFHTANTFFMSVFHAFKHMFVRRSTAGLGGPLMIITATARSAARGFKLFLLLLAFISMNLAALNTLPLPILDGGQALIFIVEALIRRQLPEKIKTWIFVACWAFMILLLLLLTMRDARNLFFWFTGTGK